MKIAICSDHRGFNLKEQLIDALSSEGFIVKDYGCFSEERCDYPTFAFKLGEAIKNGKCEYGVAICGSGDGMCIAVNKVDGVRSSCPRDAKHVIRAKAHDDINVLTIASEDTTLEEALEMIKAMIDTDFLRGRYEDRVKMIAEYEKSK